MPQVSLVLNLSLDRDSLNSASSSMVVYYKVKIIEELSLWLESRVVLI